MPHILGHICDTNDTADFYQNYTNSLTLMDGMKPSAPKYPAFGVVKMNFKDGDKELCLPFFNELGLKFKMDQPVAFLIHLTEQDKDGKYYAYAGTVAPKKWHEDSEKKSLIHEKMRKTFVKNGKPMNFGRKQLDENYILAKTYAYTQTPSFNIIFRIARGIAQPFEGDKTFINVHDIEESPAFQQHLINLIRFYRPGGKQITPGPQQGQ